MLIVIIINAILLREFHFCRLFFILLMTWCVKNHNSIANFLFLLPLSKDLQHIQQIQHRCVMFPRSFPPPVSRLSVGDCIFSFSTTQIHETEKIHSSSMNNNIEDKNLRTPRVFLVSGCAFASFCNRKKDHKGTGKKETSFPLKALGPSLLLARSLDNVCHSLSGPLFCTFPPYLMKNGNIQL